MLFPIQMFTAASSFSVKCFALFVVCVLTPQSSYFIPSPPPEHTSPPFSLTEEKPRPRTAPSPHHTYSALCSCLWFPFPPVSLDSQFFLLSYQRLTPPVGGPSIPSALTSSGNISHSFTSLSPHAFSPSVHNMLQLFTHYLLTPHTLHLGFGSHLSTKTARVPDGLHVARLSLSYSTSAAVLVLTNGHALLLETARHPASCHQSPLVSLLAS